MRILMPIDRSAFSEAAVDFVASRTTLMKTPAEVELVNIQYPVPVRVVRALGKEIVEAHHQTEAAGILEPAAGKLASAGARTSHFYKVGTVHHELATIVDEHAADLVVMASQGESGITRLLFGSVASVVAVSCTKPLLILRGGVPRRDSLKIVLALDGSPYGLSVARFVARHHAFFGSRPELLLVHIVPELSRMVVPGWIHREVETGIEPAQARAMQDAAFRSVFEPIHEILGVAGLEASEVRLVGSDPGAAIATYAQEVKPDILAMGSLGFGTHRFPTLGSVASRVAARTATSLLLVREKEGLS